MGRCHWQFRSAHLRLVRRHVRLRSGCRAMMWYTRVDLSCHTQHRGRQPGRESQSVYPADQCNAASQNYRFPRSLRSERYNEHVECLVPAARELPSANRRRRLVRNSNVFGDLGNDLVIPHLVYKTRGLFVVHNLVRYWPPGNENCAFSRTPPDGQRCVMVLRRV